MPRRKPSEVIKLIEQSRRRLDKTELAMALLDKFGGVEGFANEFHKEFAQCAGIMRGKLLESVVRIFIAATAKEQPDDIANLADDDLDAVVAMVFEDDGKKEGETETAAD